MTNLQKAIELVSKAGKEVKNKNFEEAVTLYESGLKYFLHAIEYEAECRKEKESIQLKYIQYLAVTDIIKKLLKEKQNYVADIQKAVDLVTKAVEEDKKQNYKEALRLYESGVEHFHAVESETQNDKLKESIQAKCAAYVEHTENIRIHLSDKQAQIVDIEKAVDLVTRAVEEDKKNNYEKAIVLYECGVEHFRIVESETQNDKLKESIQAKCTGYIKRTEDLKKYVSDNLASFIIKNAVDLVTRAVEEDKKKNYEEAVRLYECGIEKFHVAESKTQSDRVKESIRANCTQYIERAENLKKYLNDKQNIEKAADLVTKADEEDKKKNYEEAIRLYECGIEQFRVVESETQNDKLKESIQAKCILYIERTENIKKYLSDKQAYIDDIEKSIDLVTRVSENEEENYQEKHQSIWTRIFSWCRS